MQLEIVGQGLVTMRSALEIIRSLEDQIDEFRAGQRKAENDALHMRIALNSQNIRMQPAQIRLLLAIYNGCFENSRLAYAVSELCCPKQTLKVHMTLLRRALRIAGWPDAITTIYAAGYRLDPKFRTWLRDKLKEITCEH